MVVFLYTDYESTVYVFQLISEVSLPEGSPIRIEFDGEEATGEVLSVHGLEIELKLNDYIQGEIREAVLYSEPWQLLEQLQERLKEARKDKLKRNHIKRLVDGTSSPKHIEKMKNPKMNWHIARFIIRQRTYGDRREQEVLQFITYYFGPLSKRKIGTCVSS